MLFPMFSCFNHLGYPLFFMTILERPLDFEVARQLLEAPGDIRVAVNAAAPGRQSKGFAEAGDFSGFGWNV